MEEDDKTGFYLQQTLLKKKVVKDDIKSLIDFVLSVPQSEYEADFTLSSDVKFALNGIKEEYIALSKKYEPSKEFVLFNSLIQDEILNSLVKLSGKRKIKKDKKTIEALRENMIIERLRSDLESDIKLNDGTFLGRLKFILKKKQII